jgi:hypothetical protein
MTAMPVFDSRQKFVAYGCGKHAVTEAEYREISQIRTEVERTPEYQTIRAIPRYDDGTPPKRLGDSGYWLDLMDLVWREYNSRKGAPLDF